jgi:chemotaxis protein CheD
MNVFASTAEADSRLPPALPQFGHIRRYWDPSNQVFAAKLLPGEYYVTGNGEMVCTVLGSCVSACVRDRVLGIGGMNHFMLPLDTSKGTSAWQSAGISAATRYGNVAMERLINDILAFGGSRANLEFKIVGGGYVMETSADIGARNIDFVRGYLRAAGFAILGEDVGDLHPRKVHYFPATGKVRVRKLVKLHNNTIFDRERNYRRELEQLDANGGLETSR